MIPCFNKVKDHQVWYIQPKGLPYSYITVGEVTCRFHAFSGNLYLGSHKTPEKAARAVIAYLRTLDIAGVTYTLDFVLAYGMYPGEL